MLRALYNRPRPAGFPQQRRTGDGAGWRGMPRPALAAWFLAFMALILLRKPGVLWHAEFWGDDGWTWYPDAYNAGLRCLLWPVNGYLNSLQRLGGLAAQAVPLAWAPTLFAAIALAMQAAPAAFLISPRMAAAWASFPARLCFAALFLLLPNTIEPYVNLTNAQWNLAILAFLVVAATPPVSRTGQVFDSAVLILSGLSGPFCLMLLPVAAWRAWVDRDRTSLVRLGLLSAAALVQACYLLGVPGGGRSAAPLGAGPRMLARIISLEVLARRRNRLPRHRRAGEGAGLAGEPVAGADDDGGRRPDRGGALARARGCCCGNGPCSPVCFSPPRWARPQVSATAPQWQVMATLPPMGNRYYYFAMLAWAGVLFTLASDPNRVLRAAALLFLLVLLGRGVPQDFAEPRFPPTGFAALAKAFADAPPGTRPPISCRSARPVAHGADQAAAMTATATSPAGTVAWGTQQRRTPYVQPLDGFSVSTLTSRPSRGSRCCYAEPRKDQKRPHPGPRPGGVKGDPGIGQQQDGIAARRTCAISPPPASSLRCSPGHGGRHRPGAGFGHDHRWLAGEPGYHAFLERGRARLSHRSVVRRQGQRRPVL